MHYLKVIWHHDDDEYPIYLYCEMDDERWETRKVEVYRDGRMDYANSEVHTGNTDLGEAANPSIEEIASDPEEDFEPYEITQEEFERIWQLATLSS